MKRRTVAIVVAGALWWIASVATAQTTTTSTSTSTSTTSTSTTSTSITSTTVANPCAGQPCTDRPPDAFLAGASGEVRLDPGSFCWSGPVPGSAGLFGTLCADAAQRDPDATLVVSPGETLTLRFSTGTPTEVILQREDVGRGLAPANPVRFTVDLPAGSTPVISFFTRWPQGDASYSVRLQVRAATPVARPLALTG
jgi:hypothetical protein